MALRPSAFSTRRLTARAGAVASVAAASVLLVTGCSALNGGSGSSSDSSGSNSAGLEKPNITVAAKPFVDAAPLYIAQQKGYFKQVGLNVKIVSLPSATVIIPKVASGAVDIGEGNFDSVITAQYKKVADFKFVGIASAGKPGAVEVTALPSSNITNAQGLIGKNVATNTQGDVLFGALEADLKAANVDPSSVHFVTITHSAIPQAIGTNQVPAGLQVQPYLAEAARQYGVRPVIDVFSGPTDGLPYNSYFSLSKLTQTAPKTVAAFDKALAMGAADATANRKDVENILPGYTGVDPTIAGLISEPSFPPSLSAKQVQRDADLMTEFNISFNTKFDVSSMCWTPPGTSGNGS
ncbi:MAG TPA: ABC transporter substrate-binding protein [Pseudonocardiaceae bacterium]|nr:ABC transporter substrate-binding protein [Pseudonocardiaceae bacterium]